MRRPCVLTCAWSPMQCIVLSHRRFSPQMWIGISRSRAPYFPVANPVSGNGELAKLQQGQRRSLRGPACLAEDLQRSANLQAFTDWLIDSGGQGVNGDTQRVEFYKYGEDGRGLRANTDIKDGDLILTMPLDLVLAHKSDEEEFNAQLGDNLDEFTAMAVKLLRERAQLQQSRYYPYIQVLPKSVPSLYGGFPESLREELQGFVSDPDWEEGRNRTAFEYAKIALSPLMSGLTEEDFRWAYSVVSSRAFAAVQQAPDGSKVKMKFFAPLLDMMDHGGLCQFPGEEPVRLDNVRWDMKDVGSGTWQIQAFATQDISKGKPLLLRYIDGFPGTHYLMHYGFAPMLDPNAEVDLFPHMYGAVNWTLDKLFAERDGLGEAERQQLAAEAHRAAREVGLKDIMAANQNGGVTRDVLRKAHPLAVKLKVGAYLDARLVAAIDVLKHRWQAPVREKGMSVHHILLERIKEMLTEPGRTSLGADLKLLNDNAVPADCNLYDKCLKRYRAVASAAQKLPLSACFVQDYESPARVAEEQVHLDTCTLQAVQLRVAQKMLLMEALVFTAEKINKTEQISAKRRAKDNAGSRSSAPKGFGAVARKGRRKQ